MYQAQKKVEGSKPTPQQIQRLIDERKELHARMETAFFPGTAFMFSLIMMIVTMLQFVFIFKKQNLSPFDLINQPDKLTVHAVYTIFVNTLLLGIFSPLSPKISQNQAFFRMVGGTFYGACHYFLPVALYDRKLVIVNVPVLIITSFYLGNIAFASFVLLEGFKLRTGVFNVMGRLGTKSLTNRDITILVPLLLALVGTLLGALVMVMDWDTEWVRFPWPVIAGGEMGRQLGYACVAGVMLKRMIIPSK
eukprot:gnl/Dysnectes_brevis/926_a1030_2827.p1 GENE.gnl/Dysnectes_brevis/926_a1030_2827~~gnl/Dysnectes_brevis/926_a1030_2827.p1  ORF type:complete len:249 (+),score=36.87 gnl/Dysnectes_brevis/926_a1030_2827:244-990(+)